MNNFQQSSIIEQIPTTCATGAPCATSGDIMPIEQLQGAPLLQHTSNTPSPLPHAGFGYQPQGANIGVGMNVSNAAPQAQQTTAQAFSPSPAAPLDAQPTTTNNFSQQFAQPQLEPNRLMQALGVISGLQALAKLTQQNQSLHNQDAQNQNLFGQNLYGQNLLNQNLFSQNSNQAENLAQGEIQAKLTELTSGHQKAGLGQLPPQADAKTTQPQARETQTPSASQDYWSALSAQNSQYLSSTPARQTLKTYLQERCAHLSGEEIDEVLELAKELENQAVAVFKAQGTHKTKLQEQNRQAISKLATDSASARGTNPQQGRTFTRSEISKMSMREFLAHQPEILAQYDKVAAT